MLPHHCYLSFDPADREHVDRFRDQFDLSGKELLVPLDVDCVSLGTQDPFRVMHRMRDRFLGDTTVTIVLLGERTWALQSVDWELAASLRDSMRARRSGIVALTLPGAERRPTLPPRLEDNLPRAGRDTGYARVHPWPEDEERLELVVADAHEARRTRWKMVDNRRVLFPADRERSYATVCFPANAAPPQVGYLAGASGPGP